MEIVERVEEILRQGFQIESIDVGRASGSQKISGHIVSADFEDMDMIDRQKRVRQLLKERLGPDVQKVSTILIYTPREFKAMTAA